jgi:hypothetical protein
MNARSAACARRPSGVRCRGLFRTATDPVQQEQRPQGIRREGLLADRSIEYPCGNGSIVRGQSGARPCQLLRPQWFHHHRRQA